MCVCGINFITQCNSIIEILEYKRHGVEEKGKIFQKGENFWHKYFTEEQKLKKRGGR